MTSFTTSESSSDKFAQHFVATKKVFEQKYFINYFIPLLKKTFLSAAFPAKNNKLLQPPYLSTVFLLPTFTKKSVRT